MPVQCVADGHKRVLKRARVRVRGRAREREREKAKLVYLSIVWSVAYPCVHSDRQLRKAKVKSKWKRKFGFCLI